MWRVLGMPISTFTQRLLTEPLLILKTCWIYFWLWLQGRKRRLDLYDPIEEQDLTKVDVVIPPIEKEIDEPCQNLQDKTSDSILIYGGNTSGARLLVRMCREKDGHVPWLYLRLPDGRSYVPPCSDKIYPPSGDFTAGGLRIKCRTAFRQWRVSFNGILRESKDEEKETKIVHVKFSFLCRSSSYPFDMSTDIHPSVMAEYLARESYFPIRPDFNSVSQHLGVVVQSVNILGTFSIDSSEESEMFLWGARRRGTGDFKSPGKMHMNEFLGYSKDGQLIYSGELILPGAKSMLEFAFYLERSTLSWPVLKCHQSMKDNAPTFTGMKIHIETERSSVSASVGRPSQSLRLKSPWLEAKGHLVPFTLQDGDTGHGVFLEYSWASSHYGTFQNQEWKVLCDIPSKPDALILPLQDPSCQDKLLTGGKGASLAVLTYLAQKHKTSFKVPGGFVITTHAYKDFFNKAGIHTIVSQFENKAWSCGPDKIKETCNQLVDKVSKAKLPEGLQQAIEKQLSKQFSDITSRRFAVRSSASGEDSEDMSAAGQMSTLLGVQGVENVCEAVVKCWASQFAFTAIQYKRQNGQVLNSPMAVVVQEMVAADSAGVLFTCDPVTGNPQNITITANFGLGESVVSASADPDTVVLWRNDQNQLCLKSTSVGKKSIKIVMGDKGNVLEEKVEEAKTADCCLTEKQAMVIAETGLKIEEAYGLPIDIEWAFKDNQLYMLQARPVTTIDVETRFEVANAISSPFRVEDEYNTKANVGEVLPGATSHFSLAFLCVFIGQGLQRAYGWRNKFAFPYNPFYQMMVHHQNHFLLSMPNFLLRFYSKDENSFISESNAIAGFGRVLDDKDMLEQADKRNRMYPTTFVPLQLVYFVTDLIFGAKRMVKNFDKVWNNEIDLKNCSTSKDMFYHIWRRMLRKSTVASCHVICSSNSSLYNNTIMGMLATANKGWGVDVFSDISVILSSCGNLESADIPRSILKVVEEIKKSIDVSKFKQMTVEEAHNWLESTRTSAGTSYREFLSRHGHRCLKEFDFYTIPWRLNQLPLVKTLQDTISNCSGDEKPYLSTSQVLKRLKVPISWKSRLMMKVLIPLSRSAVYNREKSKAVYIKALDQGRKAFWAMAEQMVKEGRLPEQELMFFLSHHEVLELIETRNPALVQRAIRRKHIYAVQDKLKFPEIMKGIPKAINTQTNVYEDDSKSDLQINGTPVSQGVVRGFARVAKDIEEAATIKRGEVLIAYSTDIAWSPYFPLLSGVASELGGLVSHGAVVAREYGLPCVVGVHDATLRFKTGDYVLLDGSRGILKRLEPPKES